MKTFEYRGYDAAGSTQKGLVEALDIKQAREKIVSAGIYAETVRPTDAHQMRGTLFARPPFARAQRAAFYDELASLQNGGLPLATALEVMLRSPDLASAAVIIAGIRDKIREGHSLADAIAAMGGDVYAAETAFIAAGEKSGELAMVLRNLADFMGAEIKLREKIITALIYPVIIIVLALGIATGLLGFTVPRLAQVLSEEMNIQLPLITRITLAAATAFMKFGPFLLMALIIVVFAAFRVISRSQKLKIAFDRKLFTWPLIGKCYATLAALRYSRALALLLRGGVPLVESVNLAGLTTGSISIADQSAREAEAIRNGSSLSESIARVFPLGGLLSGIVQIGENSGTLDEVLRNAEKKYEGKWEQQTSRIMAWLEPALILCVGFFVLIVVISILLPILSLNRQIM
jgi:general secretion pathway protein F